MTWDVMEEGHKGQPKNLMIGYQQDSCITSRFVVSIRRLYASSKAALLFCICMIDFDQ